MIIHTHHHDHGQHASSRTSSQTKAQPTHAPAGSHTQAHPHPPAPAPAHAHAHAHATTPCASPPHCAAEVERYASKTLKLIVKWIQRAEGDPTVPACKWESSTHLRRAREIARRGGGGGGDDVDTNGDGNCNDNDTGTGNGTNNGTGTGTVVAAAAAAAAAQIQLSDGPVSEEALFTFLEQTLEDSVNPWTHRFLDKLYTVPTTPSPALELMLGALNASGVVSSASPALSLAEEETVEGLARLMGWKVTEVDGLTMPGGSASNRLAVQTALGNAFPTFKAKGLWSVSQQLMASGRSPKASRPVLLTSEQSHYSIEKAALACGMGLESVLKVRCDAQGGMRLDHLESILVQLEGVQASGEDQEEIAGFPFFINVTSGTTILGAFDNIRGVVSTIRKWEANRATKLDHLRRTSNSHSDDRVSEEVSRLTITNKIWIHVDASWGGPVLFSSSLQRLMDGVEDVDSLTINPHKVLNITQQCSFALFKRATDLTVNVTGAKYLFHGHPSSSSSSSSSTTEPSMVDQREFLRRNPGAKTMGCGRRPDALKFYFEWLRIGTIGFGLHVERGVSYALHLVQYIQDRYPHTLQVAESTLAAVENGSLFLQVCFRPKIPDSLLQLLAFHPKRSVSQNKSNGNGNGNGNGNEAPTPSLCHSTVAYPLLSHSVHTIHSQLRSLGRFTVDKAPLSYPDVNVGYFIRLVTHPSTDLQLFQELIGQVDRLGVEYFQAVWKVVRGNSSSSDSSSGGGGGGGDGGGADADTDTEGQARRFRLHLSSLEVD